MLVGNMVQSILARKPLLEIVLVLSRDLRRAHFTRGLSFKEDKLTARNLSGVDLPAAQGGWLSMIGGLPV